MQNNIKSLTLKEDLKQIGQLTSLVAGMITLLTVGLQAGFLKLLKLDDAVQLTKLFFQTAPLTLTVALVTYATIREWFEQVRSWIIFFAISLGTATTLAHSLGGATVDSLPVMPQWFPLHEVNYLINLMAGYFIAYTAPIFISSLILGVFLTGVWLKLSKHFNKGLAP